MDDLHAILLKMKLDEITIWNAIEQISKLFDGPRQLVRFYASDWEMLFDKATGRLISSDNSIRDFDLYEYFNCEVEEIEVSDGFMEEFCCSGLRLETVLKGLNND